jgi:HEAT repeat protein
LLVLLVAVISYWVMARDAVTGATPQERIDSICRLADKHTPGAANAIARVLGDGDAGVRRAAIIALARFARPEDAPKVQAAMKDPDEAVRSAAVGGLDAYHLPASVAALRDVLATDPSPQVRIEAAKGLSRQPSDAAVVALYGAMEKDASPEVRLAAFRMILEVEKLGFKFPPDPKDAVAWGELCRKVRLWQRVYKAFANVDREARGS